MGSLVMEARVESKSKSKITHWIHGQAYDLTEWLPRHPGGAYLLEITRGTDCTELFESYHAPSLKGASALLPPILPQFPRFPVLH